MSTSATRPATSTTTWSIDPVHSIAESKVKHMMISSVKGHFSKIAGSLTMDESGHANSHVEATIDAASVEPPAPACRPGPRVPLSGHVCRGSAESGWLGISACSVGTMSLGLSSPTARRTAGRLEFQPLGPRAR